MEQILPLLNKNGLILTQFPTFIASGPTVLPALRTRIEHAETGDYLEDTSPLIMAKDDPQGQGSAITYMRRYALMAALGIVADVDDDANAASPRGAAKPKAASVVSAAPQL